MGFNTNRIKKRAEEIIEEDLYQDAKDEAFNDEFQEQFFSRIHNDRNEDNDYLVPTVEIFTEDDLQGFIDSFTFPEEGDWAMDKACNEADDIGDQKYQLWKDEGI